MAQEKAPAFQFYPKDFLTDGRVAAMSLEEVGAYIKLLCLCWTETSLPMESIKLARMIGCTEATLNRVWPALASCFVEVDGSLRHGRMDLERAKRAAYIAKQKANAAMRWDKSGIATASARESQTHALQSPVSSLQSPNVRESAHGSYQTTPIIGRDPHLSHTFCDKSFSYCVPRAVHDKLAHLLAPKYGGTFSLASEALKAWYPTVAAGLAPGFVMGDAFKFWQVNFDALFATPQAPVGKPLLEDRASQIAGVHARLVKEGVFKK